jgi:hypothetical protein
MERARYFGLKNEVLHLTWMSSLLVVTWQSIYRFSKRMVLAGLPRLSGAS